MAKKQQRRSKRLSMLLSTEEKQMLQVLADNAGLSKSDFVRWMIRTDARRR